MKAASGFLSAASAVALSAALAMPSAFVLQLASVSVAQAATVSSIEVRGNQRVDAETIRGYITIKPGQSFSSIDVDESVKRLFGTGLFSDVSVNQVGGTLVVQVSEYQVVNQVLFQGNKKIKDAQLSLTVQMKPRGTFSPDQLEADAEAIRAAYARIGRDDATVTPQVIDLGENRVNVAFTINEGGRTKIAAINFVGNEAFGDRRLSDVIATKESTVLSFVLRDDIYDEDRLRADEEALRQFYFNRGYADFQVVSAFGELDEATNEYTVTITVEEGEKYTFSDISVDSTLPEVPGETLLPLVETHAGEVYNAKNIEDFDHQAHRASGRPGLCLRAGHPARRPQLREPHHLGRLHDRPGRQDLCRAHRNTRQHPHARLRHPPRVRRQRRRRLQPGSDPAREETAGTSWFL